MKKRTLSILMAFVLTVSCCVPVFAQATYTDLGNHWAKDEMEDLVKRGYLSGYSDNTMQPNKNMTACELLVMLSRFYSLTDVQKEKISADYKDRLEKTVSPKLSWANESLAVCLAAGIITENELNKIDLTADIEKQQLAVFLVRAMQLSAAADELKVKELTYIDASEISESCRASIAELASLEIVKGDATNRFLPKSKVTRAVVATMISRSIQYQEKNDIKLSIEAYKGLTQEKGILSSVSASSLQFRGFDGLLREYSIPTAAKISVSGVSKTLSSTYEGCYAQLFKNNGVVSEVRIEKDSSVTWVQGTIASINSSNSSIYVKDLLSSRITNYTVSSNATLVQDGKNISLSLLSQNNIVTIKTKNNIVSEVNSVSSSVELNGTISEISYGSSVSLKIKDEAGAKYCFSFDITNLPTIKRGDTTISIDRLKTGNEISVMLKSGVVSSINIKGSEDKYTGKLTSITTSSSGTIWNITSNDGTNRSLMLDEGVAVYNGKTAILQSAIRVGDEVSVVIYGNMVTEIYLKSAVSSTNQVSGRVLTTDRQTITMLTSSEKLVYVDASSASVVASSTGKTLSLSYIDKNSEIVAYGTYKSATEFSAKLIVIP